MPSMRFYRGENQNSGREIDLLKVIHEPVVRLVPEFLSFYGNA